jgi:hypothetical protein
MIRPDTIRGAKLYAFAVQSTLHVCVIRNKQEDLSGNDSSAQMGIRK